MAKTPNARPIPATHSRLSKDELEAERRGKKYLVRDRDLPGKPGKVWGKDMTHEAAEKLKLRVVNEGKSRTARVEEVGTPRANDAQLAQMQQGARSAAQQAAKAAETRRAAAARAPATPLPPADDDSLLDDLDGSDIADLVDSTGTVGDDEISHAENEAQNTDA